MRVHVVLFFFFNDTATTEIYTLSLHDALPILFDPWSPGSHRCPRCRETYSGERHDRAWARYQHLWLAERARGADSARSEEHTSELQSRSDLVCRLLLEKKMHTATLAWANLMLA